MARLWICLVNFSQGFKKASGSKYTRAQNMARLWICEGYVGCWICLNEPEYALIMSQYTWMCLNNAEYEWIYRHIREKKQNAEYVRILNVSDAVHSVRSLHKLLSSYRDRLIQNTVKHLTWAFCKKNNVWVLVCNEKFCRGEGGFVKLGYFDKHFVRTQKEAPQGNSLEIFLQLKVHIEWKI